MRYVKLLVLFFALIVLAFVVAEEFQETKGFLDDLEIDPVEPDGTNPVNPCDPNTCNDGNPCTEDNCTVEDGARKCVFQNKADGTHCGDGKICSIGVNGKSTCIVNPLDPGTGGSASPGTCVPTIESIDFDGSELNPGEQVTVHVDVSNCNASKIVLSAVSVEFDKYNEYWRVFQFPARTETSIADEFNAMEEAGIRLEGDKFVELLKMGTFRSYVVDAVELTAGGYNGALEIPLDFSTGTLDPKFLVERQWLLSNREVLLSELTNLEESTLENSIESGFFEVPAGLDLGFEGTMGFKLQVKSGGKWKISALKSVSFSVDSGTPPVVGVCESDDECDPGFTCNEQGECVSDWDCNPGDPQECPDDSNPCTEEYCNDAGKCARTKLDYVEVGGVYCIDGEEVDCLTDEHCSENQTCNEGVCESVSGGDGEIQDTGGANDTEDVPVVEVPPIEPGPVEPEPVEPEPVEPGPVEPEVTQLSGCNPCQSIAGCLACLDYQLTAQTEPQ